MDKSNVFTWVIAVVIAALLVWGFVAVMNDNSTDDPDNGSNDNGNNSVQQVMIDNGVTVYNFEDGSPAKVLIDKEIDSFSEGYPTDNATVDTAMSFEAKFAGEDNLELTLVEPVVKNADDEVKDATRITFAYQDASSTTYQFQYITEEGTEGVDSDEAGWRAAKAENGNWNFSEVGKMGQQVEEGRFKVSKSGDTYTFVDTEAEYGDSVKVGAQYNTGDEGVAAYDREEGDDLFFNGSSYTTADNYIDLEIDYTEGDDVEATKTFGLEQVAYLLEGDTETDQMVKVQTPEGQVGWVFTSDLAE